MLYEVTSEISRKFLVSPINDVRQVLQEFQDGYRTRDLANNVEGYE